MRKMTDSTSWSSYKTQYLGLHARFICLHGRLKVLVFTADSISWFLWALQSAGLDGRLDLLVLMEDSIFRSSWKNQSFGFQGILNFLVFLTLDFFVFMADSNSWSLSLTQFHGFYSRSNPRVLMADSFFWWTQIFGPYDRHNLPILMTDVICESW